MHCCVYCKRISFDGICVCIGTACHWIRIAEIADSPAKCWTGLQGLLKTPSPYFFLWKYMMSKMIQLFKIMHERTHVNYSAVMLFFQHEENLKWLKFCFTFQDNIWLYFRDASESLNLLIFMEANRRASSW